ncbi:lipase 3 [Apiospora marii]|uniref:lipase 3 n=1 Tax=Apiospora marii TaxID=335849 RepID=UPI00312EE3B3
MVRPPRGPRRSKGQFTVGRQIGFAILNGIRMALSETSRSLTGLSVDARVARFGSSHGSLVTGFAAEMAEAYAPVLMAFVGTALGAAIANGTQIFEMDNQRFLAGVIFASIQATKMHLVVLLHSPPQYRKCHVIPKLIGTAR